MTDQIDPDWYSDNVLAYASPGGYTLRGIGPTTTWRTWWDAQAHGASGPTAVAVAQGFAMTTRQLRDAGWADHDLRREVRRGTWSTSGRGTASPVVVVGTARIDDRRRHALRATSSALRRPGQIISGPSAAIVYGLPTSSIPARPQLTAAGGRLGARSSVSVHGATLHPDETCRWFGTCATTVPRTLVDLLVMIAATG